MKYIVLLILAKVLFFQDQSSLAAESCKLVNDINAAENRKAVYMCEAVNFTWKGYLTYKAPDKNLQLEYQQQLDTIAKYLGGNKNIWLKDIPQLSTWNKNVNAAEFVDCNNFSADDFFRDHAYTGVYLYSEPLFNKTRDKALVYIWYITGRLGISAYYHYCEKENGTWKKKKIVIALGGFNS